MRVTSTFLGVLMVASGCQELASNSAAASMSIRAETEQARAIELMIGDGPAIAAVAVAPGGWVLDAEATLWRVSGETRVRVLGRVLGVPTMHPDGRFVVARLGDTPGESDLWIGRSSSDGRWLAPAPGPDEQPTVLPDGRVLFVSGRSGVMSVWIADADGERVVQRTNVGLEAGGARVGFVPPPHGAVTVDATHARWDDGYGKRWSIALDEVAP